jgi:phage/plasmid-associated DNA primase
MSGLRWKESSDQLEEFFDDMLELHVGSNLPRRAVYELYRGWAQATGHKALASVRFRQAFSMRAARRTKAASWRSFSPTFLREMKGPAIDGLVVLTSHLPVLLAGDVLEQEVRELRDAGLLPRVDLDRAVLEPAHRLIADEGVWKEMGQKAPSTRRRNTTSGSGQWSPPIST